MDAGQVEEAMQYLLFIYSAVKEPTTVEQWNRFFAAAKNSGTFTGGSAVSKGMHFGEKREELVSESVVGYMQFETDDVEIIHQLLKLHPVVMQGGTVELCETPKS